MERLHLKGSSSSRFSAARSITNSVSFFLYVTSILLFPSAVCKSHTCSDISVSHSQSGQYSGSLCLFEVITALRWTAMAIICSKDSGFYDQDGFIQRLNSRGISVVVFEADVLQQQNQSQAAANFGNILADRVREVAVLGSFDFVDTFFQETANWASEQNKTEMLFYSEWITLIPREKMQGFQDTIKRFENVAVIGRTETGVMSLWTLRHVQDDCDLGVVTALCPSSTPLPARHHIMPNPSYGLGARTLTVVAKVITEHGLCRRARAAYCGLIHISLIKFRLISFSNTVPVVIHGNGITETTVLWTSDVMLSTQDETLPYKGVLIDLLQELAFRLNFSYVFATSPDDEWGQKLDNGQWDGPIGMLTRKEIDLALGSFTLTPGRSMVADATTSFRDNSALIIFRVETSDSGLQTFLLQPFRAAVYVVISVSFVCMLLLLWLLEAWPRNLAGRHGTGRTFQTLVDHAEVLLAGRQGTGRTFQTLMDHAEVLLAGLITRAVGHESHSRGGRVLVMTWMLLGVVLASVYSSQLTSSLAVSEDTLPFTSLSQLLQQDTYTWGVAGRTAEESILKDSTIKEYQQYYQGALRFSQSDPTTLSPDIEVHKEKVLRGRYALYLATSEQYIQMLSKSCHLAKIPEVFQTTSIGLYLQKGSPYTKLISQGIQMAKDSGLIDHWRMKWQPKKRQCGEEEGQGSRVIGLQDTQTAFYLASVGLVMAAVLLGLERLFNTRQL